MEIARTIATSAKLLLLDEPLTLLQYNVAYEIVAGTKLLLLDEPVAGMSPQENL